MQVAFLDLMAVVGAVIQRDILSTSNVYPNMWRYLAIFQMAAILAGILTPDRLRSVMGSTSQSPARTLTAVALRTGKAEIFKTL